VIPATGLLVAALLVGDPDPRTGLLRFVGRVDHGLLAPTCRRLAELLAGRTAASPFQRPVPAGDRWGQGQAAEPAVVFVRPEVACGSATWVGRPAACGTPPTGVSRRSRRAAGRPRARPGPGWR
jgi:hypothetical protein